MEIVYCNSSLQIEQWTQGAKENLPILPFGSLFSAQGSSLGDDGGLIVAESLLKSVSLILRGTSLGVPTETLLPALSVETQK